MRPLGWVLVAGGMSAAGATVIGACGYAKGTCDETATCVALPDASVADTGIVFDSASDDVADAADAAEAAAVDACALSPSEALGVFVVAANDAGGVGDGGACSIDAPCGTIGAGIAAAVAQGKSFVYVAEGSTYTEVLTIPSSLTVQGAWSVAGATWSRDCGGDAAAFPVVQAPSSDNTTVVVNDVDGGVVLDSLAIKSAPQANTSEPLYGVYVALNPAHAEQRHDSGRGRR